MKFEAKGKLLKVKTDRKGRVRAILAKMHDGFLGIDHPVIIQLDKSFGLDVAKQLEFQKGRPPENYIEAVMGPNIDKDRIGYKVVQEHKIEIIIK